MYNSKNKSNIFVPNEKDYYPIVTEYMNSAGKVDAHYFLQDIYMARKINEAAPKIHYDIGSRIDGFVAHLLSGANVEKITLIDIRPFSVSVDRLSFVQADAIKLSGVENESIGSLSSLHAIEHFGLGRYGDPIDPEGWKKALHAMEEKLSGGGMLYISVPIGNEEKVCFNAHRIFNPKTIINELKQLRLVSFSYIHDYHIYDVAIEEIDNIFNKLGPFDCGLYIFRKD